MFTIISRIIHFGFKNFKRNAWLSTATVAIMVLALIVFLGVILFNVTTIRAAASIQDKIDISVFFNTNASEDQILNIQQSLEALPQVASANYTSRDQALANFTANHASDQTVSQALSELNTNPLEASLEIKAKDPSQYSQISDYLSAPNIAQYVDTQSYTNNEDIINRLAKIVRYVEGGGLGMTLVLALIAGLVVFNTVQLAIYSNREEIGVMRVVGASNALVRGPFVIEGMLCGAIAAVLTLIIVAPALYFLSPYLEVFIPGLGLFHYFYSHLFWLFLYELAFGVVIGGCSSFIAVKKYLRN
jgi:cell division transport system permease protein